MRKNEAIKTGDTRRVGEQVPIELAKTKLQRQQQRYSIDMAINIYISIRVEQESESERERERGRESAHCRHSQELSDSLEQQLKSAGWRDSET